MQKKLCKWKQTENINNANNGIKSFTSVGESEPLRKFLGTRSQKKTFYMAFRSLIQGARSRTFLRNSEPVKETYKNGSQDPGVRPFLERAGEKRYRLSNTAIYTLIFACHMLSEKYITG